MNQICHLDFQFYSYVLEEDIIVQSEINIKEPDKNNNVSDLDYLGYCDIMSIEVYHENSEPYISNNEYKNKILDHEINEHLKKQIRMLEIDDSRFDLSYVDDLFERNYYGED